jgi:hypothetical protein
LATYNKSYAPSQVEAGNQPVIEEKKINSKDFFFQIYKKHHVEKENELEKYLKADTADHDINLLDWWKV